MNNPEEILSMTDDQLIDLYEQTQLQMVDHESTLSEVRDILKERLKAKNLKSAVIQEYSVSIFPVVRFKTTLAQAQELGAVKVEEKADTSKLRTLHDAGVEVPGVDVSENIRISPIKV